MQLPVREFFWSLCSKVGSVKGAKCSYPRDCRMEACPVHYCDEVGCISVLLLLRRAKEGAGSFELQTYLCCLMQHFLDCSQCNFELLLFSHASPQELCLAPLTAHDCSKQKQLTAFRVGLWKWDLFTSYRCKWLDVGPAELMPTITWV